MKTSNGLKVIFAEPIEAGYVKIHSTWDERDEDYRPVDRSETGGKPYDLLEVFVIQQGRRNEWSYDARGNRVVSTIDNSSLVIEYYNSSDLLRKYGEWYFNYDANGNMIARGRNGTEKTSMASDALFEGYDFSSDKGELWTYEYDLSNRLVKVNYSGSGKNGLKEKCKYTYDYRGLCIAKTSGNEIEYNEYTADGKLIYTEKKGYIADYVYSGTSIFAEVRKQNGNDETFYHHTDHLGTTEVITDESGTIVWKASYEAFGAVLCENGTKVFEASFTGKFFDKDIGLYYFNARWYDAEIGRFVTQDPARDGYNWYAYCSNNPLTLQDFTGLWESKNQWNADYAEQYSNYVSGKISEYKNNGEKFTCEDFALSLLIDFASENSLPVIIKNSRGTYNSNDKKYDNPADYKKKVLSTTAAGHLLKNTIDINKGDAKSGDLVLMDDGAGNGPNSLDGKPGHTQVIEKNNQGVFIIKQGNFDESKRGEYGSDNYGGKAIEKRILDTNKDEFFGSDNKPHANASEKYGLWYRRWDFKSFNGLNVKPLDTDKMSPRMKHEMQNK